MHRGAGAAPPNREPHRESGINYHVTNQSALLISCISQISAHRGKKLSPLSLWVSAPPNDTDCPVAFVVVTGKARNLPTRKPKVLMRVKCPLSVPREARLSSTTLHAHILIQLLWRLLSLKLIAGKLQIATGNALFNSRVRGKMRVISRQINVTHSIQYKTYRFLSAILSACFEISIFKLLIYF